MSVGRRQLALLCAGGAVAAIVGASCGSSPRAGTLPDRTIHVAVAAPAHGSGSASHPFATIQQALAVARPGDTVRVAAGNYTQRVSTVRSGEPGAPITIAGARGARLTGNGSGHQVEIRSNYITLRGFTIGEAEKLVWIEGAHHVLVEDDVLENAGGECIRVKYLSTDVTIAHDTIDHCGLTGFDLAKNEHNGEGVYIGTDPYQLGRNPTSAPDASDHNSVVDNTIATYAAECVDIKEAADHNRVVGNDCSHSRDPKGSGFDARGNDNLFRNNVSAANAGAGIRFGGYGATDGTHNTAIGNVLVDNEGYGFLVLRQPQDRVCGNVVLQSRLGVSSVPGVKPTVAC
ncbi:MAG TPA: DUF1565 domain-containing protein [Gaiellaceae bacterium]